jgi:hypothetical protein
MFRDRCAQVRPLLVAATACPEPNRIKSCAIKSQLGMGNRANRGLQSRNNSHISIRDNEIRSNYLAAANRATLNSEIGGGHTPRAYATRIDY